MSSAAQDASASLPTMSSAGIRLLGAMRRNLELREERAIALIADGYFTADEEGRVWRHAFVSRSGNMVPRLAQRADHAGPVGYLAISIPGRHVGAPPFRMLAHRFIWRAFRGPIPKDREINHINGRRDDNRLVNLEVVSHAENMTHAFQVLKADHANGQRVGTSKLDEDAVHAIRRRIRAGASHREIGAAFGVTHTTIRGIATGRLWAHVEVRP